MSRIDKMLTKWSHLTRLETRTKESNTYASRRVKNSLMRNESERVGSRKGAPSTDQRLLTKV